MTDLTLRKAAAELALSARVLREWLAKHPQDAMGRPFCMGRGRGRTFTRDDLGRIALAILQQQANKQLEAPQEGWVYFIRGGEWIKIGYTRSARERIKKMVTDAPVELKILHVEPGTFKIEKLYHRHFAALRTRGEWFRATDELMAFIEQRKAIVVQ